MIMRMLYHRSLAALYALVNADMIMHMLYHRTLAALYALVNALCSALYCE